MSLLSLFLRIVLNGKRLFQLLILEYPLDVIQCITLRKHVYSNILKILPPKNENFQIKNPDILHIFAQNMDCRYALEPPRRGGSNAYPQSMFLSRNEKNNVYPCKPQFSNIKVEFRGSKLYRYIFMMRKQILKCRNCYNQRSHTISDTKRNRVRTGTFTIRTYNKTICQETSSLVQNEIDQTNTRTMYQAGWNTAAPQPKNTK